MSDVKSYSQLSLQALSHTVNADARHEFLQDTERYIYFYNRLIEAARCVHSDAYLQSQKQQLFDNTPTSHETIQIDSICPLPEILTTSPYAGTILDTGDFLDITEPTANWHRPHYQTAFDLCLQILRHQLQATTNYIDSIPLSEEQEQLSTLLQKPSIKKDLTIWGQEDVQAINPTLGMLALACYCATCDYMNFYVQFHSNNQYYSPSEAVKASAVKLLRHLRAESVEGDFVEELELLSEQKSVQTMHIRNLRGKERSDFLINKAVQSLGKVIHCPTELYPINPILPQSLMTITGKPPSHNTITERLIKNRQA